MEQIIVNDVLINGGRIEYKVTATKHIANAFHKPFSYWVEYDQNMESVPQSIAVIPFLCDILPIIWVADVELVVPELDEDYYNSIDVTRNAYINMYPNISFKGKITCGKIIKNEKSFTNSKKKRPHFFPAELIPGQLLFPILMITILIWLQFGARISSWTMKNHGKRSSPILLRLLKVSI